MMILNLEYLEIVSQPIGSETIKNISGGFVFVRAQSFASASGSIAAITSVRTQTVTANYPIFVPPILSV